MNVSERADAELVAASLAGDRAAFEELVGRHRPRVAAIALRAVGDRHEAEDVTQDALLHAYLDLRRLRNRARFGPWVYAIALNLARMRLRARRELPSSFVAGGERPLPGGATADADPSPQDALEELEALERVRDTVQPLPPAQREAVLMHYLDGLTAQEVAAVLGERTGTVRVRLHRARARLRDYLLPDRKETDPMIEVTVEDVVVRVIDDAGSDTAPELADHRVRVVLLRERDGERVLPIWVGPSEGDALALQIADASMPRPLTPDLMARLLDVSGAHVERVVVSSLRENTFYAAVTVAAGGAEHELDARPSDALNLALRTRAPIFVVAAVMESSAMRVADPAVGLTALEEEWTCARLGEDAEASGEWRSLSPELVTALHPGPMAK